MNPSYLQLKSVITVNVMQEGDADWKMIGLLPMSDPPRHDSKATIEKCLEEGIQVKMITGGEFYPQKSPALSVEQWEFLYSLQVLLLGSLSGLHRRPALPRSHRASQHSRRPYLGL